MIRQHLVCSCYDPSHQLVLILDDEDPDDKFIYTYLSHSRDGFWFRVKKGLRYILGLDCGEFHEVILDEKAVVHLDEFVKLYYDLKGVKE